MAFQDSSDLSRIFDYQKFEDVFFFDPDCSYDEDVAQEIVDKKKELGGQFIEKVMKLMGVKKCKLEKSAFNARNILTSSTQRG